MGDETPTKGRAEIFSAKDIAVFVPIAGTITALSWETGSFLPIGGHAFEQFSLAEHVVFSLPALPFAITLVLIVAVEWIVIERNTESRPAAQRWHPMDPIVLFVAFTNLATGLYLGILVFMWMSISTAALVVFLKKRPNALGKYRVAAMVVLFSWLQIATYLAAADFTRFALTSNDHLHEIVTDRQVHRLVLLRSGERGILTFNPQTSNFAFLPNDGLKGNEWKRTPIFWSAKPTNP